MGTSAWRAAKLDELGFVGRGKSRHRPRNARFLYGGRYPFFQTGDIKAANFYLTEYSQTYSEEGLAQSKLWKPGTLCITIAANIAESAILGIAGCFPDSVVGFVPDPDKADVRFVKYYLEILKLRMQNISHGATQDNLSLDKLLSFDFLVPPLREQQRIAGILSAYDELIENNQKRIKILEEMARSLYREWFVKENHFRDLAENHAEEGSLSDLCVLMKTSFSEKLHASRPLLDLSRMPQRSLVATELGNASELSTSRILFEPGDTLFGSIRCYLHKVVTATFSGVTNTSVFVLRPKNEEFRSLVALIASDPETIKWAETHSTGTKMPVINWGVLKEMKVPLTTKDTAKQFESLAGPMLYQIGKLAQVNLQLRQTRNLLLPHLLGIQSEQEGP